MAVLQALSPAERWLGVGVRLPFMPSAGGGLELIHGMELVRQSIEIILETEPGERIMLPEFGCGLRRYLMAPNTTSVRASIQADVTQALTLWEPRIRLTDVTVSPSESDSQVWIDISFVRLPDLRPDNLVYPFYLR